MADASDGSAPRLTHTRLLVDEYAACFEFYRDVLGLDVTFGDAGSGYADFDAGGDVALALFDREEMADALGGFDDPGGDRVALVLAVEDVDRAHERLAERGVTFVTDPEDRPEWGLRTAHLRDPDGTLVELYEPLE